MGEGLEPDSDVADPARIDLPSRLGEMLIREGLATPDDVQNALAQQASGSEWRLGRILVRLGALDEVTLAQAIAAQYRLPIADLRAMPPRPEALVRLPREAAFQLQALPLAIDGDQITVAVADPPTRELRVALERSARLSVNLVLCPADELASALEYWYADDDCEIGIGPVDNPFSRSAPSEPDVECKAERPEDRVDGQIVDWLLSEAERRGASAVHLDHDEDGLRIRYRIGDKLLSGPRLPRAAGTIVCHRLFAAARLDFAGAGVHEGRFDADVDGRPLTCRLAATSTSAGTHVVVRTHPRPRLGRRFEDLGVVGQHAAAMRRILEDKRGVVIAAAASAPLRESVTRTIIDEIGPDDSAIAVIGDDCTLAIPGAMRLAASSTGEIVAAIRTAEMLSSDTLVLSGSTDRDATRAAFDAASDQLVILELAGDDPSTIATMLVDNVSAFLVAGTLRAVVVARENRGATTTSVHLVTDEVCRAILDIEDATTLEPNQPAGRSAGTSNESNTGGVPAPWNG